MREIVLVAAVVASIAARGLSMAQPLAGPPAAPPKYSPDVPSKITTPGTVETRIGTLRFKDGAPDPATVQLAYDQLDFGRGIDAFLTGMSATSSMRSAGALRKRASSSIRALASRRTSLMPFRYS
jgi:hypothetical protein